MVQPVLLFMAIAVPIVVLLLVILLVIKLGHPDDKLDAWFPRLVTIFGLWLAFMSILVLPYDVANSEYINSGISVNVIWLIIYITLAVLVGAVIPFAFFYYENDVEEDDVQGLGFFASQLGMALKYTVVTLIFFIIIFIIMYSLANEAYVPVLRIAQSRTLVFSNNASILRFPNLGTQCDQLLPGQVADSISNGISNDLCQSGGFYWIIPVSLPLFIVAFIAFVGWWFFTLFVGVGLFALPLDLISGYVKRPKPISTKVYFEQRRLLGERCKTLLKLGEQLQAEFDKQGKKKNSTLAQDLRAFEKNYFFLKKDYQILYVAHKERGGNPLVYIAQLILGVISICISICWVIHIAIFVLPAKPYSQFLNSFFIQLDNAIPNFPFFGIIAFTIFSTYLLWCVVKGNFRLGVRFIFWKIYPMEIAGTLMNAFLFNTLIILLCCIPAVQFCIIAFPTYAAFTQANVMFGNQIQYLTFFRYFFEHNFFIIFMICISFLTILVLSLSPQNKAATIEAQLDKLAKSTNTSLLDYTDEMKL